MVEHYLAKVRIAGPIPASRSEGQIPSEPGHAIRRLAGIRFCMEPIADLVLVPSSGGP